MKGMAAARWFHLVWSVVALALASGCDKPRSDPAASLRATFPARARQILAAGDGFRAMAGGFTSAARPGRLRVTLPAGSRRRIRLADAEGFTVDIVELGQRGHGVPVDRSVAYTTGQETSLWTVGAAGLEEWLLAGKVPESAPVATWRVSGARLRAHGPVVELVDAHGVTRFGVATPAAYAKGGAHLHARLATTGDTILLFVAGAGKQPVLVDPVWTTTPPMAQVRYLHTATRLDDGRVLVAGGYQGGASSTGTTELYDPATNSWSDGAPMAVARGAHAAAKLQNGKVLVVGGYGGGHIASAELYDPATDAWSSAGAMSVPRAYLTATTLQSGKVLVTSGDNGTTSFASAELYDPAANAWSGVGSMSAARDNATATLLANGKLLVAGGGTVTTELFDPTTNGFVPAASMHHSHSDAATAVLADGRVLIAGANTDAEIYDPSADTWTVVASMAHARANHQMVTLVNGDVLAPGGWDGPAVTSLASTERYDPALDKWWESAPLATPRHYNTVTRLLDGRVLATGGLSNGAILNSAEVFDPTGAALGAPCTSASQCLGYACVDGVCCDSPCNGGVCAACSVAKGAPKDGTCKILDATPCDDQNPCTQSDTCQTGACVGTPLTGTACDDGDACTQTDTCQAGTCVGSDAVACAAVDSCHDVGTCDPASGQCSNPAKLDYTVCDDGQGCTISDRCISGACVPGAPRDCPPADACHAGSCDPTTGKCVQTAVSDGTSCEDGDKCTTGDACAAGVCVAGPTKSCTAPDTCSTASCDPATGACVVSQLGNGAPCDDSNACTQYDHCVDGVCTGKPTVSCDTPDACREPGTCDPQTGKCVRQPKPDGTLCSDSNSCTSDDSCHAGVCTGTPSCDKQQPAAGDNSGCSCRMALRPTAPPDWMLAALLSLALVKLARRRRAG